MKMRVSSFECQVSNGEPTAARPGRRQRTARGFSLVEVLLAIFILGIGMIMVASVFPVGANWTRQTTEESIGQTVAQNALTIIRRHYGDGGDLHYRLAPDFVLPNKSPNPDNSNDILKSTVSLTTPPAPVTSPFVLQALPGFTGIPVTERAYQFGSSSPMPATNWKACTYFWTALARLNPAHASPPGIPSNDPNGVVLASSYKYDLYILVFRKGSADQVFTPLAGDITGTRDFTGDGQVSGDETLIPAVRYAAWNEGSYDAGRTPSVYNCVPALGQYGIGAYSGTVFKQVLDPATYQSATPRPLIIGNPAVEPVIDCPAADGTANSASPLIYVYQTTISF